MSSEQQGETKVARFSFGYLDFQQDCPGPLAGSHRVRLRLRSDLPYPVYAFTFVNVSWEFIKVVAEAAGLILGENEEGGPYPTIFHPPRTHGLQINWPEET